LKIKKSFFSIDLAVHGKHDHSGCKSFAADIGIAGLKARADELSARSARCLAYLPHLGGLMVDHKRFPAR
jgi:hypothetical protein